MLANWSATEISFLIIAVIQAVCAIMWACGAWWASTARAAIAHWAAGAALSSVTWFILALSYESPPLTGIIAGVLATIVLQRGIRLFIGREPTRISQWVALIAVVSVFVINPSQRFIHAAINFGALAWINFGIAVDLYSHARDRLRFRWPIILALPVLLGGVGYGLRAVRAIFWPDSVVTEMETNSALNLNGALTYIVLALALHATLMALVVGRLIDELRKLSMYDALTGLLNRRAMEEALHAQVRSSRRRREPFAVMMLDLDYFKRINDDFGHGVGDLALQHVSKLLRGALRDIDSLARFGGEEFVVLMPGANLFEAEAVAERLRMLLAATPMNNSSNQVALSISIGVAEWLSVEDDSSQLLLRADAALFQAKIQGRNRVVTAARTLEPAAA